MKNTHINKRLLSGRLFKAFYALVLVVLFVGLTYGVVLAKEEQSNKETTVTSSTDEATGPLLSNVAHKPYLVRVVDELTGSHLTSTALLDPSAIISEVNIQTFPEDDVTLEKNDDLINYPLVGYVLTIDRANSIELSNKGSVSLVRSHSNTIKELLDELQISLSPTDTVVPGLSEKITDRMEIAIYAVGKQLVEQEESLPFSIKYIDDSNRNYGDDTVKTKGKAGKALVTYEITLYDGNIVDRKKIESKTTTSPVTEIVIRGTKGAPSSNGPLNSAQIQFLGGCESGMTATRNSGNGYYGAFQFSIGTWNAMGTGYARADLAPLDVQIQAVQNLLSRSSIFGQFPGCANAMVAAGLLSR